MEKRIHRYVSILLPWTAWASSRCIIIFMISVQCQSFAIGRTLASGRAAETDIDRYARLALFLVKRF